MSEAIQETPLEIDHVEDNATVDFGGAVAPPDDQGFEIPDMPEEPPTDEFGTETGIGGAEETLDNMPESFQDTSEETQSLPCRLTNNERAEMGTSLAGAVTRYNSLKDKKKLMMAEMKEGMETQMDLQKSLSTILMKGTENRDVKVKRVVDRTREVPVVECTRLDTNEIIYAGPLEGLV